jgi:multiple sugar transport system substrate-binding protein
MHVIEGGYLPTRKALYLEKDVIKERPYVKVMGEIAEYTKPRPVVPYYSIISDILQKNVQSALLGKASAQDALNAAAKEIQGIMG